VAVVLLVRPSWEIRRQRIGSFGGDFIRNLCYSPSQIFNSYLGIKRLKRVHCKIGKTLEMSSVGLVLSGD